MAEFRRALHRRIAALLAQLDADFLQKAQCYFGGGTQLAMSHGEYRESRDIDLLVSSREGFRMIRETVSDASLGSLFRDKVMLAREVRTDRDAVRTFIREEPSAAPLKLEIIVEARLDLGGQTDADLKVPVLSLPCAIAEKLLANADRGRDTIHRSRDLIDLAFVALAASDESFNAGCELACQAYGKVVMTELAEVMKMLEFDAKYRAQCIEDLAIDDVKGLRKGIERLKKLKRIAAKPKIR